MFGASCEPTHERRTRLLGFGCLPRILSGRERTRRIVPWHIGARRGRGCVHHHVNADHCRMLMAQELSTNPERPGRYRAEILPPFVPARAQRDAQNIGTGPGSSLGSPGKAKGCHPRRHVDRGQSYYSGDIRRAADRKVRVDRGAAYYYPHANWTRPGEAAVVIAPTSVGGLAARPRVQYRSYAPARHHRLYRQTRRAYGRAR